VHGPFILFVFSFVSFGELASWLCLLHSAFHFLDELRQLSVFFVFDFDCLFVGFLFLAKTGDYLVSLLELLLDYFQLLGVGKGVFWFYHFLKLLSESNTLVHVELDLDFSLMSFGVPDISFQKFNFVLPLSHFGLKLSNLPLQVCCQMSFGLPFSQVRFLLRSQQIVNNFVLFHQFSFNHGKSSATFGVFIA